MMGVNAFYLMMGVLLLVTSPAGWASALQWERTEVRLIAREGDEKAEATYPVKNTGSRLIKATRIETGCGCTSVQLTDNQVLPGASSEVKVTFKLEGRVGAQSKIISIKTDEEGEEAQQLWLKVDIISPVVVQPRMVFWRVGEAAEAKGIEVAVTPGEAVELGEATCDKPGFTATWAVPAKSGPARLMIKPVSTSEALMCPVQLTIRVNGVKRVITLYGLVR